MIKEPLEVLRTGEIDAVANAVVSHAGESLIMETGTHPSAFVIKAGRIRMTSLYMACVQ